MGNCCQTHQQSSADDRQTSDVQLGGVEFPAHTRGTESEVTSNTKANIAHALWMKEYEQSKIPPQMLDKIHGSKNSPRQFAARRSGQMQNYLNNPVFLNPDYTDRYTKLLEYTSGKELSPQQIRAMSIFLGLDSVTGYNPIPIPSGITWPESDNPQWKYQVGWHFFVGNCVSESNQEYGIEMMFWRDALLPLDMALIAGLDDIENQTVTLHLAISDKSSGIHYRAEPTIIAGTTGLIDFSTNPIFNYQMGNNRMKSLQYGQTFPIRLQAMGFGQVENEKQIEEQIEIGIDLTLDAKKHYFLEGDGGCSPSVDGIGTLYYSISNLQFQDKTTNTVVINGESIHLKSAKFWYDHQWATGFMPPGNPKHAVMRASGNIATYEKKTQPGGWDWFMVQFDSDVELTFSAIHSVQNEKFYGVSGDKPPGTMTATIHGKYISKDSIATNIAGTLTVSEWWKSTITPNPKIYWSTSTWYPNHFQLSVESLDPSVHLPEECLQFHLVPIVNGQTGFFGNGLQYSEGGVTVYNEDGGKIGMGFAEATGYAKNTKNVLAIAGLPQTQEIIDILEPKSPVSEQLAIESGGYLLLPGNKAKLEKIMKEAKGLNN